MYEIFLREPGENEECSRRVGRGLHTAVFRHHLNDASYSASEALFLARISPFAIPAKLTKQRVIRLHEAIQQILNEAIAEGSTLRIDLDDEAGDYIGSSERFWRVYEREGQPCVCCGGKLKRVVQGGRSTYFCPRCQR